MGKTSAQMLNWPIIDLLRFLQVIADVTPNTKTTILLNDVTFTECGSPEETHFGGAIYLLDFSRVTPLMISLVKSTFENCFAQYGAAIYAQAKRSSFSVHLMNEHDTHGFIWERTPSNIWKSWLILKQTEVMNCAAKSEGVIYGNHFTLTLQSWWAIFFSLYEIMLASFCSSTPSSNTLKKTELTLLPS